jgi:hypothetical protein
VQVAFDNTRLTSIMTWFFIFIKQLSLLSNFTHHYASHLCFEIQNNTCFLLKVII